MLNSVRSFNNSALNKARAITEKANKGDNKTQSDNDAATHGNGPGGNSLSANSGGLVARQGQEFSNNSGGFTPSVDPGIPSGNPDPIARLGGIALDTYPGMPAGARDPVSELSSRSSTEYHGIPTSDPGTHPQHFSTEALNTRADELNNELGAGLPPTERNERQVELTNINDELEHRALDALETHLVETESAQDNVLSHRNIENLARDTSAPKELQQAAQFYLDNPSRLSQLSTRTGKDSYEISIGDIHDRQLDVVTDIDEIDAPPGSDSYNLPNGTDNVSDDSLSPNRDQALFDQQQDAIEEAIKTGDEVEFVNSNGETIAVSVERVDGDDSANYEVRVGDADSFSVSSEIEIEDTISGIASVIEFGTTMDTSADIRQFPDSVTFAKGKKPSNRNSRASYSSEHELTYWDGDKNYLSPERYYHEIAHGIGRDLHDATESGDPRTSSPEGWKDIHDDIDSADSVSDYSESNESEGFAEAFAAYMSAKNHGPAALEDYRAEYPDEAAYIDENVFGITNAPS